MQAFMEQVQAGIRGNPTAFFILFFTIVAVIIFIYIVTMIASHKKKRKALLVENVVELFFGETVFPASTTLFDHGLIGYRIFSVNGQPPCILGTSILVPAGKVELDLQYLLNKSSFERQTLVLDLEEGTEYKIDFDVMEYTFSCTKKS